MTQVLLAIHIVVAVLLIGLVMLQKSEGGALGIGGGGGGNLFSTRGVGNALTRATAILAACFFATSIALTILANRSTSSSIVNSVPVQSAPSNGSTATGTPQAPQATSPVLPNIGQNKPTVPTNQ